MAEQRSKWVVDLESVVNSLVKGVESVFSVRQGDAPGTEPPPDGSGLGPVPIPCPQGTTQDDTTGECVPVKKGSTLLWVGLAVAGVAAAYFIVKKTRK